jgi:hypothetical protein
MQNATVRSLILVQEFPSFLLVYLNDTKTATAETGWDLYNISLMIPDPTESV